MSDRRNLRTRLEEQGYSGLWNTDGCGCRLDDAQLCGCSILSCLPGYRRTCGTCPDRYEEDGEYRCESNIETGDGTYSDDEWCICETPATLTEPTTTKPDDTRNCRNCANRNLELEWCARGTGRATWDCFKPKPDDTTPETCPTCGGTREEPNRLIAGDCYDTFHTTTETSREVRDV